MEQYQYVLETLRGIIAGSADALAADDINADSELTSELGIDSLTMFEIADKAQERWGIRISDDDISEFTTVDSMVAFIQAAAGAPGLPSMTEA